MAKSCLSCVHLKPIPFGEGTTLFCTRAPPNVEVVREVVDGQGKLTLQGWYPPMPNTPCGEHKRAWWRRAKRIVEAK